MASSLRALGGGDGSGKLPYRKLAMSSLSVPEAGWLLPVIGFAGGAVMATLINAVVTWFFRPRIKAQLLPNVGCYVPTRRQRGNEAMFLRLRVKNKGLSSIRECRGYIIQIIKEQNGKVIRDEREVLELPWALSSEKARHIPRGAFLHLDVAALDRQQNGPSELGIGGGLPRSLDDLLDGKAAEFSLHVLIAADNARPRRRRITLRYDPSDQDLKFLYDRTWWPGGQRSRAP
jgi:hypothetical protein